MTTSTRFSQLCACFQVLSSTVVGENERHYWARQSQEGKPFIQASREFSMVSSKICKTTSTIHCVDDHKAIHRSKQMSIQMNLARTYHPGYSPGTTFHNDCSVPLGLILGMCPQTVGVKKEDILDALLKRFSGVCTEFELLNLIGQSVFTDRKHTSVHLVDKISDMGGKLSETVQRGKGGPLTFGAGKAAGGSFVNIKEIGSIAANAVRRETRGHTGAAYS